MSQTVLYRIVGKRFVCGLVFTGTLCVKAAPILRWVKGKQLDDVQRLCEQRGWTMEEMK